MNYWVTIYRFAWGALIVIFIIASICVFLPRYNRIRQLQKKKIELQEENHRVEARIEELRIKQQQFSSDPTFVERTAREIGMIKPDETVFKFTNEQSRAGHAAP